MAGLLSQLMNEFQAGKDLFLLGHLMDDGYEKVASLSVPSSMMQVMVILIRGQQKMTEELAA